MDSASTSSSCASVQLDTGDVDWAALWPDLTEVDICEGVERGSLFSLNSYRERVGN